MTEEDLKYLKRFCKWHNGKIEGKYCVVDGHKYYQFSDKGGIVETTAEVTDNARVYDNAIVADGAEIHNNANIYDNAIVYGYSEVSDNAKVYGNATVSDNAQVFNHAKVYDNAGVSGHAWIDGDAEVYDNAEVLGEAIVYGNAKIHGNARVACSTAVKNVELTGGEYCSPDPYFIIDNKEIAEKVRKYTEKFREIIEKY